MNLKYKHYDVLSEFFHCNVLEDVPVSGEAVDSLTAYRTPGIMNFILQAKCLAVSEVAACILSQSHTLHSSSVLPEYSSTLPAKLTQSNPQAFRLAASVLWCWSVEVVPGI